MSHHGNQPPNPAMSELMRKLMGEYPNGRMSADDSGAVALAVSVEEGRVRLDFPQAGRVDRLHARAGDGPSLTLREGRWVHEATDAEGGLTRD